MLLNYSERNFISFLQMLKNNSLDHVSLVKANKKRERGERNRIGVEGKGSKNVNLICW